MPALLDVVAKRQPGEPVAALYGVPEAYEPWGTVRQALAGSTQLLLGCTEDFAELVTG
ncbi:MAG: hypothetical protein IPM11_08990 [Micropruina sp.]|nr:hypothetical protein [Micropruina sp.]